MAVKFIQEKETKAVKLMQTSTGRMHYDNGDPSPFTGNWSPKLAITYEQRLAIMDEKSTERKLMISDSKNGFVLSRVFCNCLLDHVLVVALGQLIK